MAKFKGMVAAVPTPFNEDESINFDAFEKLLEHVIGGGMHCLLIGGSTGEYSLLSVPERKSLIEAAVKITKKRTKILAGCSNHRPCDVIDMAQFSAEVGADMALVLPPYYMKTSRQGLIDYFTEIAEKSPIGIMIYHYPLNTGVYLEPELIVELGRIKNIVAVKNTDEMDHTAKLIALSRDMDDFSIINGYENLIMGTLALGGEGTMGLVHNLAPKHMVDIFNAMASGDLATAQKINATLAPLYNMMESEPYPGPLKAALSMMGIPMGVPRKPIVPPSEEMKANLRKAMMEIGIL